MGSAFAWYGRQYDLLPNIAVNMRLYHNPRCSKSRQAFALLQQQGIDFEDYRYLERGISPDDMDILLELSDAIRLNDISDKSEYNLNEKNEIQRLLHAEPKALQRPILIHKGKAVIGRPPESILTLLHES
jgi:arsenate reductase